MKLNHTILALLLAALAVASPASAQESVAKKPSGLLGDLVAVDAAKGSLSIRMADGATAVALVSAGTEFLRVQPGKTSLDGAEKISMAALAAGDRVWARGTEKDAVGALVAKQVVLMSAKAISEVRENREREWRSRGARGIVKAVDVAKGEVTIEDQRGTAIVVAIAAGTPIRRLAPGATDLAGAQAIKLRDLAPGNDVAVLGERSADGARVTAEEVVTGTFPRPVRGRVTSVDAAKGEIRLTGQDEREITMTVAGASIRKWTPPQRGPRDESRGESEEGTGERRRSGFGFFGDKGELERRTTQIALADIAPGDIVFGVPEPGTSGDTMRVNLVVKVEIPAGTQRRGQNGLGDGMPAGPIGIDMPD